jgi:hypothetical protein
MPVESASWRDGLSPELQAAVEAAMAQYAADESYESMSPRVSDTLQSLDRLAHVALEFATILVRLSPVAQSALSEVSCRQHSHIELDYRLIPRFSDLSRMRLGQAVKLAANLSSCAETAGEFVRVRHMSAGPIEQGSGSSAGRESDLRAVGYDDAFAAVPFKSPKDKYAVRVIEALAKASHPLGMSNGRGCRQRLKAFLDSTWAEMERGAAPSWERVVKVRRLIADKAMQEMRRRAEILRLLPRRNRTSA